MSANILIIEDDSALREMLAMHFEDRGMTVCTAGSCEAGLALARDRGADLILLDQQLPDGEGLDLLPALLEALPGVGVIMMTGRHELELAIRAIKTGARDFVHKPIRTEALQAAVDKVLTATSRRPGPGALPSVPSGELIGRSEAMLEVSKQIALCAASGATVLIGGESGTGKEIVARMIHQHSGVSGPFVAINCAAIVGTLLESELFGHERGAFTGAERSRPGRFEQATDGTLFLDEIAELAEPLQAKLLRALQERSIERVGGGRPIEINARIIAASHRDLFEQARAGRFREDLAYRLSVIDIRLPALRERRDDIPMLAAAFLDRASRQQGSPAATLSRAALERLQAHDWPGNVRELNNVLTQALVLARNAAIDVEHIRVRPTTPPMHATPPVGLLSLEEMEAMHIQQVLTHTGGHKGMSCEILRISRPALDRKIRKYGLQVPQR